MDPQERLNSFLAYLEDSPNLTPEQKREIEGRIEAFRPYQSDYLPLVFPGGIHWFYAEDRVTCAKIIELLFHNGNLKASSKKLSEGWKTLRIEEPDFMTLDLLYSYKNNIINIPGVIIINKIADKKGESSYLINKLTKMKTELISLNIRNYDNYNKVIKGLDALMVNIYDNSDVLNKDLERAIKRENRYSIIRHLAMVFKHYVSEIGSEVLCYRIKEMLVKLYPDKNYNFEMVKKDLQRHKLL